MCRFVGDYDFLQNPRICATLRANIRRQFYPDTTLLLLLFDKILYLGALLTAGFADSTQNRSLLKSGSIVALSTGIFLYEGLERWQKKKLLFVILHPITVRGNPLPALPFWKNCYTCQDIPQVDNHHTWTIVPETQENGSTDLPVSCNEYIAKKWPHTHCPRNCLKRILYLARIGIFIASYLNAQLAQAARKNSEIWAFLGVLGLIFITLECSLLLNFFEHQEEFALNQDYKCHCENETAIGAGPNTMQLLRVD
ncbi:MAG: hypothetical protein AAGF04_02885 [Chlamydiota bacterium]